MTYRYSKLVVPAGVLGVVLGLQSVGCGGGASTSTGGTSAGGGGAGGSDTCSDNVKNGDEADVDCGGSCDPCGTGKACATPADCKSGECKTYGDKSICTEACTDTCPAGLSCFEGFCAPADFCDDPDGDGFGDGPGCTGTVCDLCSLNATCSEQQGEAVCTCNAGYTGDGKTCVDVDECATNADDCDTNASCLNTPGSFACACKPGFTGDGKTCSDSDECALNGDNCDANATCTNTPGGFTCLCNTGFTGNGLTCTDTDECATNADNCDVNATCTNTPGSFTCACNTGYAGNGVTCTDVDECAANTDNCDADATCTNTPGGFTCACNPGFGGNGITCAPFVSCKALHAAQPALPSGDYVIDTGTGGPVTVHCDMTTDGGAGYTMVRFDDPALGFNQNDYRAKCASFGMEPIVPRTKAHALAIKAWNNNAPPSIVNVFPKFDGATGLSNWEGRCKGAPCSFYLSNSNNAGCLGFEPNGDNNVNDAIYLADPAVCDYGHWNDANNTMSFTGSVVCSTNDAGPAPADNCKSALAANAVFNAGPLGITGVYPLLNTGTPFDAYCDMTSDGGGWTLAIKADGSQTTFSYNQAIWTNAALLNANAPDLDGTEAKLATFNLVGFTEVRVGMAPTNTPTNLAYVNIPQVATSLFAVFQPDAYIATSVGRNLWKGLVPTTGSLQPFCDLEGFNVRNPADPNTALWPRARIGILGNQENDCFSPDSRIGIGTQGDACGMIDSLSVGNSARCSPDLGDKDVTAFGVVLVR